ncbi:hypothetical protein HDA40_004813 [Hamadaea flava]|uniref:PhoX family protein n=1 Tax=Hamadaea flava TaxID=1742688 RepID=A0ABV8LFQ8_9ACTN|nr:PhoX family phosphatase [Hamadaea flava]MCP2326306.1 hypothetical protein [Hamadaea flava]
MTRKPLPLLSSGHSGGSRSAMTCLYRCGNACDHPAPNESGNEYFGDMARSEVSRRGVLQAAGAGAIVLGLAGAGVAGSSEAAEAAHGAAENAANSWRPGRGPQPLTFGAVEPNTADALTVAAGYAQSVVIRWGDAVVPGAPAFDAYNQSPAAQEKQFGYNNDFVAILPLDHSDRHALLVCNHEYTNEELMFPGFTGLANLTVEQQKTAIAAHGMSVVEIERVRGTGQWRPVAHGRRAYNRRISALSTKFRLTGPVAGTASVRTAADPAGRTVIGTLNNCSGGVTPWGTVLSGEENFNQYFVGADGAPQEAKASLDRYGISTATRYPSGSRQWDKADPRFDLTATPNEANRFGWIVEVDPFDPDSTPRKHTALGRFKHEAANIVIAPDGRVAVYMGDDERFDYLYKFVTHKRYRPGDNRHNLTLLESGDLYVAKFSYTSAAEIDGSGKLPGDGAFDGSGVWLPLVKDNRSMVEGMTVEQVLVHTRLAADKIGPTKMDRPEDVEANPVTGHIYVALTNNTQRGTAGKAAADEVNPRNANKHGHILELVEDRGDHAGTSFTWSIPIVCGDPADPATYFAGYDKTKVSRISCPDNVMFDRSGNLWISTDGNAFGTNDGLFAVPLSGPEAGHLKQFLTVPKGAETCGPALTGDGESLFVAVQHPGEFSGASWDSPASVWPDGDHAKPGIAVVWHPDGRSIGR